MFFCSRTSVRQSVVEVDADECEAEDCFVEECDGSETGFAGELCSGNAEVDVRSPRRGKRKKKVRMTKNEKKVAKGLLNLIRFCDRYLYECYGVRVHKLCEKRAKNIWAQARPKLIGYKVGGEEPKTKF
jgi:hypothetical protein